MAAIGASDVTVTITKRWIGDGGLTHVLGTLALGDGSKTYSTAGIPLPAVTKFGFRDALHMLQVYGNNERTVSYLPQYGPTAHTLLLYEEEGTAAGGPLLECDTSEAPAAVTYSFYAIGQ